MGASVVGDVEYHRVNVYQMLKAVDVELVFEIRRGIAT